MYVNLEKFQFVSILKRGPLSETILTHISLTFRLFMCIRFFKRDTCMVFT